MKLSTEKARDLFDGCFGGCRFGGDAGVEVVGLEGLAAAFAIAIDFGSDPDDGAGKLPIVLTASVCHPDHLAISQATARAVERVRTRLPNQPDFYFSAFPDAARRHIVAQGGSLSQAEVADRLAASLTAPTGCDLEIAITPEIRLQLLRSISCHGSQARSLAPLRSLLLSEQDRLALGFNLAPLSS